MANVEPEEFGLGAQASGTRWPPGAGRTARATRKLGDEAEEALAQVALEGKTRRTVMAGMTARSMRCSEVLSTLTLAARRASPTQAHEVPQGKARHAVAAALHEDERELTADLEPVEEATDATADHPRGEQ